MKLTGHEKQRITVRLAVKADGWKMKPFQQFQWVVEAWKQINQEINIARQCDARKN